MKVAYIGKNEYRVRWFKNPFAVKVLVDGFIGPDFINMAEFNLHKDASDELALNMAKMKIAEIKSYQ